MRILISPISITNALLVHENVNILHARTKRRYLTLSTNPYKPSSGIDGNDNGGRIF